MFRHAGESGAKIFDGVKVNSIQFVYDDAGKNAQFPEMGRPVSARWSRKDGTSGSINFEYIVDASWTSWHSQHQIHEESKVQPRTEEYRNLGLLGRS